jgi:hypothetical protein
VKIDLLCGYKYKKFVVYTNTKKIDYGVCVRQRERERERERLWEKGREMNWVNKIKHAV